MNDILLKRSGRVVCRALNSIKGDLMSNKSSRFLLTLVLTTSISCQQAASLKPQEEDSSAKVVHSFVDKTSIVALAQEKVGKRGDVKVCAYEVFDKDLDNATAKKVTSNYFSMDKSFQDSIGVKFLTTYGAVSGGMMLAVCAAGSVLVAESTMPLCLVGVGVLAGSIAAGVAKNDKLQSQKLAWQTLMNTIEFKKTREEYSEYRKFIANSSNTEQKCPDVPVSSLRAAIKAQHRGG
jgi:hypothetical protein